MPASQPRPCPCCGAELPLGLFSQTACVEAPFVVQQRRDAGLTDDGLSSPSVIIAGDRSYLLADASLPIDNPHSPVSVRVWVEVAAPVLMALSGAIDAGDPVSAEATLACDWPAFPGSIGSHVRVQTQRGRPLPRITFCSDNRISRLSGQLSHDHYTVLYRLTFGGPGNVVDAEPHLRAVTAEAWRQIAGRDLFTREIAPPPGLAGIQPAQVVWAPPRDTGRRAFMGTIGIAEATPDHRVELAAWVRDPGDAFMASFGDFCYWTRQTQGAPRPGTVIPEQPHIPDSDGMAAWLFCEPWWVDAPTVTVGDSTVALLAAVPIHEQELTYARNAGAEDLIGRLELFDVDVSDLRRQSCVS